MFDKKDDVSYPIVIFPVLDSDVAIAPFYDVYISQLILKGYQFNSVVKYLNIIFYINMDFVFEK